MKRAAYIAACVVLLAAPVLAVEPDEVLDDPVLEQRARDLSRGLRCLVCRNESIDESNAALARDLRILLRDRLVAGDSDEEAIDFIVARYGEFVLLKPQNDGVNRALWLAGPAMFLVALGTGFLFVRRRAVGQGPEPLSDVEQAELQRLLDEDKT